jgi:hypothetical protein
MQDMINDIDLRDTCWKMNEAFRAYILYLLSGKPSFHIKRPESGIDRQK